MVRLRHAGMRPDVEDELRIAGAQVIRDEALHRARVQADEVRGAPDLLDRTACRRTDELRSEQVAPRDFQPFPLRPNKNARHPAQAPRRRTVIGTTDRACTQAQRHDQLSAASIHATLAALPGRLPVPAPARLLRLRPRPSRRPVTCQRDRPDSTRPVATSPWHRRQRH